MGLVCAAELFNCKVQTTMFEKCMSESYAKFVISPCGAWGQLTAEEVEMIAATLDRSGDVRMDGGLRGQGHFFQCPNGHSYAIGECGGAMQASRCPECGASIGGASHALAAGNRPLDLFRGIGRGP